MSASADQLDSLDTRLSPRARALAVRIDALVLSVADRWLLWTVGFLATVAGCAVAAPLFRTGGLEYLAESLYAGFSLICHQHPDRSFHLAGEPMAFCQRDTAIFAGGALTCAAWAVRHTRPLLRAVPLQLVVLMAVPMAIDGLTQLVGLRESTWHVRVATGALFAAGLAALTLPHLDRGFARLSSDARAANS